MLTTADINQPNGVPGLDPTGVLPGYVITATLATLQTTVQALVATVAALDSREATHFADRRPRSERLRASLQQVAKSGEPEWLVVPGKG